MSSSDGSHSSPGSQRGDDPAANRLAQETSAYLRQHRTNPVDWYPWGDEALARARAEDRPLLVSIGYSACHWCHVMERESFEDPSVAAVMNERFVNIKVDREERPDVDQLYMDAALRLLGRGGWPLTVFCTPDGRPFYVGTYFPVERQAGMPSFREVLDAVHDAYRSRRDEVEENATKIVAALAARPDDESADSSADTSTDTLEIAAQRIMTGADSQHGGFGGAPKFPTPTNLEFLLTALDFLEPPVAGPILEHCALTAQCMAHRGLWDHLGGGFHRYCVDGYWGIPHFEKMLYDQGLLLRFYAELWRRSEGQADFAWPLRECAAYLAREMTDGDGSFYASQDADSEGVEGSFYVWRPDEVRAVLGLRAAAFDSAYGVTEEGNFEGGTTHLMEHEAHAREVFADERAELLAARAARVAPATDRKRVAAWNGYAISGLARAGSLLDDPEMLRAATRAADFVLQRMRRADGSLARIYNEGRLGAPGFLDDYAAMLDACLDLHRAGAGDRFADAALELADQIATRFYDAELADLFYTPKDGEPLVHRPRSDNDGATPQASGLALVGLLRAASLSGRPALREIATRVLESHAIFLDRAPHAFPTMLRALALWLREPGFVLVVGPADAPATQALAARARREFLPEDAVVLVDPEADLPSVLDPDWLAGRAVADGPPKAFVCRGRSCSLPVTDPDALTALAGRDAHSDRSAEDDV